MRFTLLTIGTTDRGWVEEGLLTYVSRLRHYVQFQLIELPGLRNTSSLTQSKIREKEGEALLGAIKPTDDVILLDEHGREFRSIEFASMLQERMSRSSRDIVFVIGGAYGFSDRLSSRANSIISLSKMTFSHQMVRIIFAEQFYRALTILKGEPYHHE